MPMPSASITAIAAAGRLRHRVADRGAHESGAVRRGHDGGERPGEERARKPRGGKPAARARERAADLEQARKIHVR
ncbi:MAG: hypothetical protein U1F37_09335 [Alphaproteobacteria bacterium]